MAGIIVAPSLSFSPPSGKFFAVGKLGPTRLPPRTKKYTRCEWEAAEYLSSRASPGARRAQKFDRSVGRHSGRGEGVSGKLRSLYARCPGGWAISGLRANRFVFRRLHGFQDQPSEDPLWLRQLYASGTTKGR